MRQPSSSSRSFNTRIAANNTDKNEPQEVVSNYVYDVPEKKPKIPGADYDDHDDLENDDFDPRLDDDETSDGNDELDFELRQVMSEDENEMAYFAHRLGGSDFKLLRRHVLHPHGRIRSIWDTITLLLTTWILIFVPFELCFPMGDSLRRSFLHLDLFVDAMFVVDILLNFNTAVEDDGKLHFSYPSILRSYTRGWFVPEVLWTLPFYLEFALGSRVLQDGEVKTRYIAAFYWSMMTMTTVGYGDSTPNSLLS
ncbi:Voltage-gated Ion Channel (VIC) Superfamily [Phytophthora cinnamomi]|uniref:Voltage-gated Ion Channel (VIC) Superfamily n=1 Tax=Phytophthora cinnamomi TaxID=4785 RepID=UPI00355961F0|nr:Voltage-gated Ion Channel (VIC) Superfamily [Phytophthora cinnamomi]